MGKNHLKFVSIPEAITEIETTLLMESELKKRQEIEPLLRRLEDFRIRKGTKKVHPLDFVSRDGLWIKFQEGEYVNRCPWLRKLPKQNKYICRIHGTKPEHCRNFPKSKRHALDNDCKGFPVE